MASSESKVSPLRVLAVLVSISAVCAAAFWAFWRAPLERLSFGSETRTGFAVYLDVTATPLVHFEAPVETYLQDLILGFVVADPHAPCTPSWGAYSPIDRAAYDFDMDRRIAQLRLDGGNVRVSFGGAANQELALACTDAVSLRSAYLSVVERYHLSSIDLDIEGDALADNASVVRRAQAIKQVQDARLATGQPLQVWLTLPTSTSGLTDQGNAVVQAMLSAGVDLAGVNAMAMDFGESKPQDMDMSNAVDKAVINLHHQLSVNYLQSGHPIDADALWAKIGITPMIGQNDIPSEKFTIGDARSLNEFALRKRVGLISMWSLNRDSDCRPPLPLISEVTHDDCSGVDQRGESFAAILANGTATPALPPSEMAPIVPGAGRQVADDPYKSPYPVWEASTAYSIGSKVVWQQQVYQAKRWATGFPPDTQVERLEETPWQLLGPVMQGEKPAPLPIVKVGTYPAWSPKIHYPAGSRVQVGTTPYQSRWWTTGRKPEPIATSKNPWTVLNQ